MRSEPPPRSLHSGGSRAFSALQSRPMLGDLGNAVGDWQLLKHSLNRFPPARLLFLDCF